MGVCHETALVSVHTSELCEILLSIVGVVVYHRSMVNWSRGVGSVWHWLLCILQYAT